MYNNIISPLQVKDKMQSNLYSFFRFLLMIIKEEVFTEQKDLHLKVFNAYFYEKMPDIYEIMDRIIDVELPKESPEINHEMDNRAIAYTPEVCMIIMNEIKENIQLYEEIENKKKIPSKYYSLKRITECKYSKIEEEYNKYKQSKEKKVYIIYSFNNEINNKKDCNEDNDMREIKKAIKVLIENADSIVYDNTITNINDFVRTIKRKNMIYYAKNPLIEHNIFILESYLKIINSKFQDNINELFQEIKNELTTRVNAMSNEIFVKKRIINLLYNYIEEIEDKIKNYEKITICTKAKQFINNSEIYAKVILKDKEKEIVSLLEVENSEPPKNKKGKKTVYKETKEKIINISQFIERFNTFNFKNQKNDIFFLDSKEDNNKIVNNTDSNEDQSKIPETIKKYLNIVKGNIKDNEFIYFIIEDYIYDKLFYNIYPKEPSQDDKIIFDICYKLSWIQGYHLGVKNKKYLLEMDRCLSKGLVIFDKFQKERNPYKKVDLLNKIWKIFWIESDHREMGIDDFYPIMILIVVKSKPKRFSSDVKYCELYIGNIEHVLLVCSSIIDILKKGDIKNYGIEKEEYELNCKRIEDKITL